MDVLKRGRSGRPHVGQAFAIECYLTNKKTGNKSYEIAYGITSKNPEQCNAQSILATKRNHWTIENSCHYVIDWDFDEDCSWIRTGFSPEDTTRLRRFAIGMIKSKKTGQLNQNVCLVFDYLRMTKNPQGHCLSQFEN